MKGYGLTVVSGEKIDRFGVEVIGIVPNLPPGRSMIVIRVSGLGLEESGVVAGMSGSPIYLEDRLAGALAVGWGFTKTPLAGVTPIEQMLSIDSGEAPQRPLAGEVRWGSLAHLLSAPEEERLAPLTELFEGLVPAGLPSGASSLLAPTWWGFPAETLARREVLLSRLGIPASLAAAGVTSPAAAEPPGPRPPEPPAAGSAITALLVDGDLQLGVTGTVTSVAGSRFLAFGHPFLGWGRIEIPVAPARIVTVVPNLLQSFKLGYALSPVWRLTADRDVGVAGRTDGVAPTVPVSFQFDADGEAPRAMAWRVAPHPRLLPVLLVLSADAALTIVDSSPRDRTLGIRVVLRTVAGPFVWQDELTGPRAKEIALLTAAALASLVEDNEWEDPQVSGVEISVHAGPGERQSRLVDAALSSAKAAPGETISVTARLADRRGSETTKVFPLTVPPQTPEGKAVVLVSDGLAASSTRLALQPAEPRSLAGLKRLVERLVPTDQIALQLLVPARGAPTGDDTLTALPPTTAVLLAEEPEGTNGKERPLGARIVSDRTFQEDRPIVGSVRLDLEIERPRS